MGRKSKLTDKQWDEVKTLLKHGMTVKELSKKFGVAGCNIRSRFSNMLKTENDIAHQIVSVEEKFNALEISSKLSVLSIADELRSISINLASAAKHGSLTAHRLFALANKQSERINPAEPMTDDSREAIQAIAALTKVGNESASLGVTLINANKEIMKQSEDDAPLEITLVVKDAD